jgi:hypothetical protein
MADINKTIQIISKFQDNSSKGIKQLNKNLDSLNKTMSKLSKGFTESNKKIQQTTQKSGDVSKKVHKQMQDNSLKTMRTWRMLSLSMMVGGYAIYRVFKSIAVGAVSAFQDIISTNGFMNTNLNILAANWMYLKYTIGSALNTALGPLMPMIINIVNKIADWVQKNPELTSNIILWTAAISGAVAILGTLGYALSGLTAMFALNIGKGAITSGSILSTWLTDAGWGGLLGLGLSIWMRGLGMAALDLGTAAVIAYISWKLLDAGITGTGFWSWAKVGLAAIGTATAASLTWSAIAYLLGLTGVAVTITGGAVFLPALAIVATAFFEIKWLSGRQKKMNEDWSSELEQGSINLGTTEVQGASTGTIMGGNMNPLGVGSGWSEPLGNFQSKVDEAKTSYNLLNSSIKSTWPVMSTSIQEENKHMWGNSQMSTPFGWSILEAQKTFTGFAVGFSKGWSVMSIFAQQQIMGIISMLNKIPLKIVTIHETVEISSRGRASNAVGYVTNQKSSLMDTSFPQSNSSNPFNITMNNNFTGVGKDTSTMINDSINKAFQQAYQTAKQYQT